MMEDKKQTDLERIKKMPAPKQLHGILRGMENKFKLGYRVWAEIFKFNARLTPDERFFLEMW